MNKSLDLLVVAAALVVANVAVPSSLLAEQSASQQGEERITSADIKRQSRELIETLERYSAQQREAAFEEARKAARSFNDRIEKEEAKLQSAIAQSQAATGERIEFEMKALRKANDDVQERLDALERSSQAAWERTKANFVAAFVALGESFIRAREAISKGKPDA